eukprot:scaffold19935_cov108-Isochrysis_galbana.AAC.5
MRDAALQTRRRLLLKPHTPRPVQDSLALRRSDAAAGAAAHEAAPRGSHAHGAQVGVLVVHKAEPRRRQPSTEKQLSDEVALVVQIAVPTRPGREAVERLEAVDVGDVEVMQ